MRTSTQSVVPYSEPKFAQGTTKLDFFQLGSTTFNSYIELVRGPGVTSFDLDSLYYVLAVDDGAIHGLAQGGLIAITSFKATGERVSRATWAFSLESVNEDFGLRAAS